ncbi:transcription-repair coupling factor [Thermoflexibacter ruber]|uniref:Transcription-repair-coupling factor n=1 Tax=Thermoflexibacter ruber TaxID=1003 RepID=A0A1I2FA79_9BACT|nr:transcription-repair coupling factor [Thermoflexibacter ruber]SFF02105.1 transcription-repair coupling factor (superfamily II helicase) [Thermoflexibacter ruber]
MKVEDFVKKYTQDTIVQSIAETLKGEKYKHLKLKGLVGSLDAVVASALYLLQPAFSHIFVLHDKEEAYYFANDLQNLLPNKEILFFPTSYKRPYQFEETENANVLQRAEVLSRINQNRVLGSSKGDLIVSYPEALTEKVINKKSLVENTYPLKVGDSLDLEFLGEVLQSYEFERTDFVYEAGQFAIRGGIIDIFSYSNEKPYRLELFGNEIESIRTFDPISQLSEEVLEHIIIIPNVGAKLFYEVRESFFKFITPSTLLWFKDLGLTKEIIQKYFEKATEAFETTLSGGNIQLISKPEDLFETADSFTTLASEFVQIEFGKKFISGVGVGQTFSFEAKPQPSFHKDFNKIGEHLDEMQINGYQAIIFSDSAKQLQRLSFIFEETNPNIHFEQVLTSLREGFSDKNLNLCAYTDHQLFERFHRYKSKENYSKSKAMTLKELRSLQIGDFVTHVDHGIARFAGLEKVEVNGKMQESIRLVFRDDDLLYINIHSLHKIAKFTGKEGTVPSLNKLGSQEWDNKKKAVRKKVQDIARELISLYAKRREAKGFAFSKDNYLQAELESSFLYEDTPDQAKATAEVKTDMEKPYPMDRLVCGDVGFGKTEVAIRAAFKAVCDSKQVAVLVPTTILAIQHFKTFKERLKDLPCKVDYINRFRTTKEINQVLKDLKEGKIDILIGTHRIVNDDVVFKDLGLMIIDEEQKFGVKVKEKLKHHKVNVDSLTLTATPIPRTLHFSLMGARDLSIIATPPPNRQPVSTEIHTFSDELIRDAIRYELERGGQVFFVHNRVADIDSIANIVLRLVPDAKICIAHGQMDGALLEKTMLKFIDGEYDILISTNIIESGLDIPNANTIIINNAHHFGLADLHQMRGRVGRSNRKAFCYLLTPMLQGLTADSRKRLSALEEFSEVGDGFRISMRDLDIRGAGDLLGAEQSGFISDLGFEMYHQILDEAIQDLKENEFKSLFENELENVVNAVKKEDFVKDCAIETDLEILIPDSYVTNISERLQLYTQADKLENEEEMEKFKKMLTDRFGKLPEQVEDLLKTVKLRWLAKKIGLEKLVLKNQTLKGYFAQNDLYFQSEIFGRVLAFVQKHNKICKLKETNKGATLIIEEVKSIERAMNLLREIQ